MTTRKLLHESGALLKPPAGAETWPIRIITEGLGSSGYYSRELLEGFGDVFNARPSFMDHPIDTWAPQRRSSKDIAGRVVAGSVEVKEVDGVMGVYAEYLPNSAWREYLTENADLLGLSIYVGASGHEDENGNWVVTEFDRNDPYSSVDVVVAAGRGGRFETAKESMRVIKESAGTPAPNTSATSAEEYPKEGNMDEVVKALEALTTKLDTFLTESAAARTAAAEAEASAETVDSAVEKAVTEYSEKAAAVAEAELLPSQREEILAKAKTGADVAPLIESAKRVIVEAATAAEAAATISTGYVLGGATGTASAESAVPAAWS